MAGLIALCCAMLVGFGACSDQVPAPGSPTPAYSPASDTPSTTPNPTATPALFNGLEIIPLATGAPADLPKNTALILETGCWGCSGGPSGLLRVYTRPDGSIAYEPLIDREELGIPPQLNTAPDGTVYEFRSPLTGYAIRPDSSLIVASLCSREHCGLGGEHYEWSANSQTAIFSSDDGGITWTEIGRVNVGAEVVAILPDDRILLRTFHEELTTTFQNFPDFSPVEPPPQAVNWSVEALPDGDLVWRDSAGVPLRSNGQPVLSLTQDGNPIRVEDLLIVPQKMDGLALLSGNETHAPYANYLVPFDSSGTIGRGVFADAGRSVVWSGLVLRFGVALLDEGLILGNASLPTSDIAPNGQPLITDYDPVVVDLSRGTMSVLRAFVGFEVPTSRNHIVAIQQGPFAKVVNTGACLNIRDAPGPSARILTCAAEGVLLRVNGGFSADRGRLSPRRPAFKVGPAANISWMAVKALEGGPAPPRAIIPP